VINDNAVLVCKSLIKDRLPVSWPSKCEDKTLM